MHFVKFPCNKRIGNSVRLYNIISSLISSRGKRILPFYSSGTEISHLPLPAGLAAKDGNILPDYEICVGITDNTEEGVALGSSIAALLTVISNHFDGVE